MGKPKLLDTFCKAGGAGMGYHQAGFEVVGVDIEPQSHYPFDFVQANALEFIAKHGHEFDVIHTSPPCQLYSVTSALATGNHPDLILPTRQVLQTAGKPYVIENVPGAPLKNPLMLCGTMFGLQVIRHRLFECSPIIWWPPSPCQHIGKSTGAAAGRRRAGNFEKTRTASLADGFAYVTVCGNDYLVDEGRQAMGIDWMTKSELSQAIPPAYTRWLGKRLIETLHLRTANKPFKRNYYRRGNQPSRASIAGSN